MLAHEKHKSKSKKKLAPIESALFVHMEHIKHSIVTIKDAANSGTNLNCKSLDSITIIDYKSNATDLLPIPIHQIECGVFSSLFTCLFVCPV